MIRTKLIIVTLLILSSKLFSQNTSPKFEISKPALTLIKKDLQICDSLAVAYQVQKKGLTDLASSNLILLNNIEAINAKSEFWSDQMKKKESEIAKLQRRKKSRYIWLGAGVLAGLVTGVVISK